MITSVPILLHADSPAATDLVVYTDGSAIKTVRGLRHEDAAGWAFVATRSGDVVLEGLGRVTATKEPPTSGRAELQAILEAIVACRKIGTLRIVSDSLDIVQKATLLRATGTYPKHRKDRDLWAVLRVALTRHDIEFAWVRGHADDPFNARADELACRASRLPPDRRQGTPVGAAEPEAVAAPGLR